jgi:hypothetical protein
MEQNMLSRSFLRKFLMTLPIIFIAASLTVSVPVSAADLKDVLPDVVARGLAGYAKDGAEAAVRAWVAGGPLESDEFVVSQASGLKRIETFYGAYQGYDLIRSQEITPRLKAVYLTMYFEKGPAFCYLLCYQTASGGWAVSDFDGSTSPRRILPEFGATAAPLMPLDQGQGQDG